MDKTQDYIYFLKENNDILEELKEHISLTYDLLYPVIIVLDELVSKDFVIKDLNKSDAEALFSEGYEYLYNSLDIIKSFLENVFDDNVHELLTYDQNVYETLKLEELDSAYNSKNEKISSTLDLLYQSVEGRRRLDASEIEYINNLMMEATIDTEYLSIPDRYIEIADVLGLDIL